MAATRQTLDLVGATEAAAILGRDVATVHRWALCELLPTAHRMPGPAGAVLFHRADVEALAARLAAGELPSDGRGLRLTG